MASSAGDPPRPSKYSHLPLSTSGPLDCALTVNAALHIPPPPPSLLSSPTAQTLPLYALNTQRLIHK